MNAFDARALAAVALGGGIGATLRYATTFWLTQALGPGFPWATFAINVSGSFLIGIVAEFAQTRAFGVTAVARLFFAVGVLGGYTTFSSFSFELFTMVREGGTATAFLYAGASVLLGFGAAYAGVVFARALVAHA